MAYQVSESDFTQISPDSNGNPRYVFDFFVLADDNDSVNTRYNNAVYTAKKLLNGKKFHNKQYGGGIVFSTYNLKNAINLINKHVEGMKK